VAAVAGGEAEARPRDLGAAVRAEYWAGQVAWEDRVRAARAVKAARAARAAAALAAAPAASVACAAWAAAHGGDGEAAAGAYGGDACRVRWL
jgi:hypothetical protein